MIKKKRICKEAAIMALFLLTSFGCEAYHDLDVAFDEAMSDPFGIERKKERQRAQEEQQQILDCNQKISGIYEESKQRGYITVEELNNLIKGYGYSAVFSTVAETLLKIMDEGLLPFKAMFYLALEKEAYDEAEMIKRQWVVSLKEIEKKVEKYRGGEAERVRYQIEKLTSVVGLTDPILVTLRKELVVSLKDKNWDDAQKIQNLILSRTNELRPPQPQTTAGSSSQTTVVVQQPSEQHIEVENVPRYGAEDVGRAMSLLSGQGGQLTDEETGTLRLFDILLKR